MRILVVEDERKVAAFIRQGLAEEGHAVEVAADGEAALDAVEAGPPFDLVVLDVMLPKRDGLRVLRDLRARRIQSPVLLLTARDGVADKVAGLDAGADDYLVKPFAFAELLARIRTLARRGRLADGAPLVEGDLRMDRTTRRVTRSGQPVELTVREYELLEHLLRSRRQVVSREALAREVWKETMRTSTLDNVIDVHIARLRRKIDLDRPVKLIHTIRGVGFMVSEIEP
jgi:DNA-binding response OmpR family regulator